MLSRIYILFTCSSYSMLSIYIYMSVYIYIIVNDAILQCSILSDDWRQAPCLSWTPCVWNRHQEHLGSKGAGLWLESESPWSIVQSGKQASSKAVFGLEEQILHQSPRLSTRSSEPQSTPALWLLDLAMSFVALIQWCHGIPFKETGERNVCLCVYTDS